MCERKGDANGIRYHRVFKAGGCKEHPKHLQRAGYPTAAVCTSGIQALSYADRLGEGLVICGYRVNDMIYSELREDLPPDFEMILVASKQVLSDYSQGDVVALSTPLRVNDLINTVEMITTGLLRKKKNNRETERTEKKKNY